jgi:hypothetical protein
MLRIDPARFTPSRPATAEVNSFVASFWLLLAGHVRRERWGHGFEPVGGVGRRTGWPAHAERKGCHQKIASRAPGSLPSFLCPAIASSNSVGVEVDWFSKHLRKVRPAMYAIGDFKIRNKTAHSRSIEVGEARLPSLVARHLVPAPRVRKLKSRALVGFSRPDTCQECDPEMPDLECLEYTTLDQTTIQSCWSET